jgi:hypothetical protein
MNPRLLLLFHSDTILNFIMFSHYPYSTNLLMALFLHERSLTDTDVRHL